MKKEISIKEIKGIRIGQAENAEAGTGCTVFLSEKGMAAGLDVRGGGPASRESELLNPLAAAQAIHGILLAGGSAFGLGGADGVMKYLEERGIGFEVGPSLKVPLVCQADLFDLTVGDPHIRPDKAMGYEACINAEKDGTGNYRDGNYGAGCGATVGKFAGMDYCMKSGIGSYALQIGELQVGAVVAVNALGDIYDWKTGQKIAGLLAENKKSFRSTEELMYASTKVVENKFTGNTTIGVVLTTRDVARELFKDDIYLKKLTDAIDKAIELSENQEEDLKNIHELGEGWVAEETLAIALYCSLRYQNDFSAGIISAVNHKGDSDSTGAVTGNILGAWLGYEQIEDKWKQDLELSEIILEIAGDISQGCRINEYSGPGEDPDWERKYIFCRWKADQS